MELAFTILAGFGALIFLSGYFGFVFAGFKHHFVTGLISALPVLNIVTVPALWRNVSRKVITSIFGLIIVIASWFLGANTGIPKYVSILKGEKPATQTVITNSSVSNTTTISAPADSSMPTNIQSTVDESKMILLPKKALYRMGFEAVAIDKIQTLKDRVVKIITTKNDQLEGRVNSVSASSIVINGSELPIANIKKISLMVKKTH